MSKVIGKKINDIKPCKNLSDIKKKTRNKATNKATASCFNGIVKNKYSNFSTIASGQCDAIDSTKLRQSLLQLKEQNIQKLNSKIKEQREFDMRSPY